MSSWLLIQGITTAVTAGCMTGYLLGHADLSHPIVAPIILLIAPTVLITRRLVFQRRVFAAAKIVCRPQAIDGLDVWVGPLRGGVFVAGLLRPQIFCDERVLRQLDPGERHAVLRHERAHQMAHDPVRRAVIDGWGRIIRWLPDGPASMERAVAKTEIRADRSALASGCSRWALASALMKVSGVRPGIAGYSTATELRLRALLDGDDEVLSGRHALSSVLLTALPLGVTTAVLIVHHVVFSQPLSL